MPAYDLVTCRGQHLQHQHFPYRHYEGGIALLLPHLLLGLLLALRHTGGHATCWHATASCT